MPAKVEPAKEPPVQLAKRGTVPVQAPPPTEPAVPVAAREESSIGQYPVPDPKSFELNGYTLIPLPEMPTVFSVAKALGRSVVQIHNDVMDMGIFDPPHSPIRRVFVYRVFEKYNCSPIFGRW